MQRFIILFEVLLILISAESVLQIEQSSFTGIASVFDSGSEGGNAIRGMNGVIPDLLA